MMSFEPRRSRWLTVVKAVDFAKNEMKCYGADFRIYVVPHLSHAISVFESFSIKYPLLPKYNSVHSTGCFHI